jgi:hypothetical protein
MAKIIARNASLGIDDSSGACRALSSFVNNVTLNLTAEAPETTGFGDTYRTRMQDGVKDGELSFDAFLATGANETDAVLFGILGGSTRWVFGPSGSIASGSPIRYAASAILTQYQMTFALADAAQVSGTFALRTGAITRDTWAN